jgi:quercetin dioxygenase-like cupin family protein
MHAHPHEQFGLLLQGRLRLRVGDEEREIGPGEVWHAPPNVVHGGTIVGDEPVVFIDVFHPIREDVLEEMRGKRRERPPRGGPQRRDG